MLIEILDSMIIGGEPRQVGDVVEVDEDFGNYQIRRQWARVPKLKPEPVEAQPPRRQASRRSTNEQTEESS